MGNDVQYPVDFGANCKLFVCVCVCVFLTGLVSLTVFDVSFKVDNDEIRRLGKRFRKLDIDGSGALSKEEFMQIHDLQQNPLVQRVIELFDTDGNGEVDFKGRRAYFHPF